MTAAQQMSRQRGISLMESLVAIVLMALGILGVLGSQLRTLADTQSGMRRAQALRLIDDLSERLKNQPDAMGQRQAYVLDWGAAPIVAKDCRIAAAAVEDFCDAAELRTYDLQRWLQGVREQLPHGDAALFLPSADSRQLGVMLAWHENERPGAALATAAPAARPGQARCPDGRQCHLQYLSLTQRCLPDRQSPSAWHCAE